jgi:hypothetical protein
MAITCLKYWAWQVGSKTVLGLIYFAIISEGLRQIVPVLAQRLYKLPGLTFLQDYEATYRLDLAPFFALFQLIAVWYLWGTVLNIWIFEYDLEEYSEAHRQLIAALAITILGADTYLFYAAVSQMGWSTSFSFTAMIATAAYLGVLIFVLYVSQILRHEVQKLEGK